MRRFSTAAGDRFRIWSPVCAALRVEYGVDLLREARLAGSQGILYGWKSPDAVRVAAARAHADPNGLAGLGPVGIFVSRERGEVFLTESDLERFESTGSSVALVIAGASAGFFVREQNGTVQSIRSHQELPCPSAQANPGRMPWALWLALLIGLIALAAFFPAQRAPLSLQVREDGAQLRLAWTPVRGRIEIRDGASTTAIPIAAHVSSATYVPQTGDVEIRLISGRGNKTVRYLRPDPAARPLH